MELRQQIETAILTTLVVSNKQSLHRAVDKIIRIVDEWYEEGDEEDEQYEIPERPHKVLEVTEHDVEDNGLKYKLQLAKIQYDDNGEYGYKYVIKNFFDPLESLKLTTEPHITDTWPQRKTEVLSREIVKDEFEGKDHYTITERIIDLDTKEIFVKTSFTDNPPKQQQP